MEQVRNARERAGMLVARLKFLQKDEQSHEEPVRVLFIRCLVFQAIVPTRQANQSYRERLDSRQSMTYYATTPVLCLRTGEGIFAAEASWEAPIRSAPRCRTITYQNQNRNGSSHDGMPIWFRTKIVHAVDYSRPSSRSSNAVPKAILSPRNIERKTYITLRVSM